MTLPLPKRSCARLTPSIAEHRADQRRACTAPADLLLRAGALALGMHLRQHVLGDLGVRLGAVLQRQRVVALGAVADVLARRARRRPTRRRTSSRAGSRWPAASLMRGRVHHAPAPQEHVVGPVLADLQPGRLLLDAGRAPPAAAAARSRASCCAPAAAAIGSLPYGSRDRRARSSCPSACRSPPSFLPTCCTRMSAATQ